MHLYLYRVRLPYAELTYCPFATRRQSEILSSSRLTFFVMTASHPRPFPPTCSLPPKPTFSLWVLFSPDTLPRKTSSGRFARAAFFPGASGRLLQMRSISGPFFGGLHRSQYHSFFFSFYFLYWNLTVLLGKTTSPAWPSCRPLPSPRRLPPFSSPRHRLP